MEHILGGVTLPFTQYPFVFHLTLRKKNLYFSLCWLIVYVAVVQILWLLLISCSKIKLRIWFQGWVDSCESFLMGCYVYLIGHWQPLECVLEWRSSSLAYFSSGCIILFYVDSAQEAGENYCLSFVLSILGSEVGSNGNWLPGFRPWPYHYHYCCVSCFTSLS